MQNKNYEFGNDSRAFELPQKATQMQNDESINEMMDTFEMSTKALHKHFEFACNKCCSYILSKTYHIAHRENYNHAGNISQVKRVICKRTNQDQKTKMHEYTNLRVHQEKATYHLHTRMQA